MDIEPPIKPATDSDDNKSNDSTASTAQLQEMSKNTTPISSIANDNATLEAPVSVAQTVSMTIDAPAPQAPVAPDAKAAEPVGMQGAPISSTPPVATAPPPAQVPLPAVSVPALMPHSQDGIPPPNVTVSHHQGVGIPGSQLPPHGSYPGFIPQGPPRAPFYGQFPSYQQGYQQYSYGHHMPPYQQNYHAPPPAGYIPPPGGENPYPMQGPPMSHQPLPPPVGGAPPTTGPAPPEEPADKTGS